jgi:hypothetical protein
LEIPFVPVIFVVIVVEEFHSANLNLRSGEGM